MKLTEHQLESFRRDGYLLVENVFDPNLMDEALQAVDRIIYGKSFAEVLAEADQGKFQGEKNAFTGEGNTGRSQFPTSVELLDRLIENEDYLDLFEQLLGDKPVYNNGHLFVRSGPTDKRHPEHPWQGYHIDHDTNTFLPPHEDGLGRFDYINSGVYLHDVDLDGAPMHVIPGSHRQIAGLLLRLIEEGNWSGRNGISDIRPIKEFASPAPTSGPKGAALFYSSYLVHAAVPFQNKRKQRSFWTLSLARADTHAFIKFSNLYHYSDRKFSIPFFTKAKPRTRSVFGWPEPGNAYYTPETLRLLQHWFPGINLTPYREALNSSDGA